MVYKVTSDEEKPLTSNPGLREQNVKNKIQQTAPVNPVSVGQKALSRPVGP